MSTFHNANQQQQQSQNNNNSSNNNINNDNNNNNPLNISNHAPSLNITKNNTTINASLSSSTHSQIPSLEASTPNTTSISTITNKNYTNTSTTNSNVIVPCKLQPSINTIDGTLRTAPLSAVINAATEALYEDLRLMTEGEIEVSIVTAKNRVQSSSTKNKELGDLDDFGGEDFGGEGEGGDGENGGNGDNMDGDNTESTTVIAATTNKTRIARMTSLSFAQRRHELASRLMEHIRSIRHVSALVACFIPKSGGLEAPKLAVIASSSGAWSQPSSSSTSASPSKIRIRSSRSRSRAIEHNNRSNLTNHSKQQYTHTHPAEDELSTNTLLASSTLQHVRLSSTDADLAQDSLYDHHGKLFGARKHHADIYGAMDVLLGGRWSFLSGDLSLKTGFGGDDEEGSSIGDGEDDGEMDENNNIEINVNKINDKHDDDMDVDNSNNLLSNNSKSGATKKKISSNETTTTITKQNKDNIQEIKERLQCAVRAKLVLGEVGVVQQIRMQRMMEKAEAEAEAEAETIAAAEVGTKEMSQQKHQLSQCKRLPHPLPWKMVMEKSGTVLKLLHGTPTRRRKLSSNNATNRISKGNDDDDLIYPIEARVTILSEDPPVANTQEIEHNGISTKNEQMNDNKNIIPSSRWILLSIQNNVQSGTGESDHQLVVSSSLDIQKNALHRLCQRSMEDEEIKGAVKLLSLLHKKKKKSKKKNMSMKKGLLPPRPLMALFNTVRVYSLSLQMEILSAQAKALGRDGGPWGGNSSTGGGVEVSPVEFLRNDNKKDNKKVETDSANVKRGKVINTINDDVDDSNSDDEDDYNNDDGGVEPSIHAMAILSVHFWSINNRHGGLRMGDLNHNLIADNCNFADVADHKNQNTNQDNTTNNVNNNEDTNNYNNTSRATAGVAMTAVGRITLQIRAVPRNGLEISLSGGESVSRTLLHFHHRLDVKDDTTKKNVEGCFTINTTAAAAVAARQQQQNLHLKRNVRALIEAVSNPFKLSMGNAILAATTICAQGRCLAVVTALQQQQQRSNFLPSWLHVFAECGSISIAVSISYHDDVSKDSTYDNDNGENDDALVQQNCDGTATGNGKMSGNHKKRKRHEDNNNQSCVRRPRPPVVVFRLSCDSRTGGFISTFPPTAPLLRSLACDDPLVKGEASRLTTSGGRGTARVITPKGSSATTASTSYEPTGRVTRDAFRSLERAIDSLARFAGLGRCSSGHDDSLEKDDGVDDDGWENLDGSTSASLRRRSIVGAATEVAGVIGTCAALAVVEGVAVPAMGAVGGNAVEVDAAGGPINIDSISHGVESSFGGTGTYLSIPPLCMITNQEIVNKKVTTLSNDVHTLTVLRREAIAVTATISESLLVICFFEIDVEVESVISLPNRTKCTPLPLSLVKISTKKDVYNVKNSDDNYSPELLQHKRARVVTNDNDFESMTKENNSTNFAPFEGLPKSNRSFPVLEDISYLAERLNATQMCSYNLRK